MNPLYRSVLCSHKAIIRFSLSCLKNFSVFVYFHFNAMGGSAKFYGDLDSKSSFICLRTILSCTRVLLSWSQRIFMWRDGSLRWTTSLMEEGQVRHLPCKSLAVLLIIFTSNGVHSCILLWCHRTPGVLLLGSKGVPQIWWKVEQNLGTWAHSYQSVSRNTRNYCSVCYSSQQWAIPDLEFIPSRFS